MLNAIRYVLTARQTGQDQTRPYANRYEPNQITKRKYDIPTRQTCGSLFHHIHQPLLFPTDVRRKGNSDLMTRARHREKTARKPRTTMVGDCWKEWNDKEERMRKNCGSSEQSTRNRRTKYQVDRNSDDRKPIIWIELIFNDGSTERSNSYAAADEKVKT